MADEHGRRESIAAAVDAALSQEAPAAEAPAVEPGVDGAAPVAEAKPARERDLSGKFVKGGAVEPAAPVDVTAQPQEAAKPARKMPSSWKKELEPKWSSMDPEVQEWIERREGDFHKGYQAVRTDAEFGKALRPLLESRVQAMNAQYGGVDNAMKSLLAHADFAEENPAAFIEWFAKTRQVNLHQLVAATQPPAQVDPALAGVQQQLAQLQQQLRSVSQREEQALQGSLHSELEAFRSKLSEGGGDYYEDVREDMAALLEGGRASSLEQAYDMACWARKDIREKLIAQQRQDVDAKAREDAAKKAAAAKTAAVSVRGAPVAAASAAPTDRRALISSLVEGAGGRV